MLFRLLAQLLPCVFAVTPISAQAYLITASASLRVASVARASQWVAMPCHSVPTQYRRPSVLVNAMPELSPLCHSGSFVRNARANHAHLSIAYPQPFFALPCRPQLRSYHRLCLAYHCGSHLCLCSLIGSIHFPRFPLLFIARAHSSVSAHAYRVAVSLRHCLTIQSCSLPLLFLSVFAIAKLLIPCHCGSARCIAYALPCGSLPVPCSMAQSKS